MFKILKKKQNGSIFYYWNENCCMYLVSIHVTNVQGNSQGGISGIYSSRVQLDSTKWKNCKTHGQKRVGGKREKRKGEGDCVYFNPKFGFGLDSSPPNCDSSQTKFWLSP